MLIVLLTFIASAAIGGTLFHLVPMPGEREARRARDEAAAYCTMCDGIRRSRNADID